jgi:hypothetical protein
MAGRHESSLTDWIDGPAHERGLEAAVEEALHEFRLADDLVRLREARGLSQRAVAAKLGISQPAVARSSRVVLPTCNSGRSFVS